MRRRGAGGAVTVASGVTRQTDDIADSKSWSNVDLSAEEVGLSRDGDRVILTIPVTAAQGFFRIGTGAE